MGFGEILDYLFPGRTDELKWHESLSASQDIWSNVLSGQDPVGPRDDDKGWARTLGGLLGFGDWVMYESGLKGTNQFVKEMHQVTTERQNELHGSVYTDVFHQEVSQFVRNIMYIVGWFISTAPAALIYPVLTALNGHLSALDPLLRPPLHGHAVRHNPIGEPAILSFYEVAYNPISFGGGIRGESVTFNPIDGSFKSQLPIIAPYNPVLP